MRHFDSRLEVAKFVEGTDIARLRDLVRGLDLLAARKPVYEFSLADRQVIIALRRWRAFFRSVVGLKVEKQSR
jgi:hypothetical protein